MISRNLAALGLGVALIMSAPVMSFAQQAANPAVKAEQAKKPVLKKKPAAKTEDSKKSAAVKKGKAGKKDEKADKAEKTEEKPKGLFASLFAPNKPKDKADDKKAEAKKPVVKAVAKPTPKPVSKAAAVEDAGEAKPTGLAWLFAPTKPAAAAPKAKLPPLNPITPTEKPVARAAVAEPAAPMTPEAQLVLASGNNGELRSDPTMREDTGFGIFGSSQPRASMLAETQALDGAMRARESGKKKPFQLASKWQQTVVPFSGYPSGTIVIDTANHYLYLVEGMGTARRYGIAVGKDGLQYKGTVKVGDKQEWPRWIPTKEMQERNPKQYGRFKDGMPGGGMNPLGARAIYLHQGKKDTYLRIHGTIAPQSIGTNASNGCFRMVNDDVIDLYRRVPVGTNVVVL